jgi:hypothetical protein
MTFEILTSLSILLGLFQTSYLCSTQPPPRTRQNAPNQLHHQPPLVFISFWWHTKAWPHGRHPHHFPILSLFYFLAAGPSIDNKTLIVVGAPAPVPMAQDFNRGRHQQLPHTFEPRSPQNHYDRQPHQQQGGRAYPREALGDYERQGHQQNGT